MFVQLHITGLIAGNMCTAVCYIAAVSTRQHVDWLQQLTLLNVMHVAIGFTLKPRASTHSPCMADDFVAVRIPG
jgi:hypothetical protein